MEFLAAFPVFSYSDQKSRESFGHPHTSGYERKNSDTQKKSGKIWQFEILFILLQEKRIKENKEE